MILSDFQKNVPNAQKMEELGIQLAQGCLKKAISGFIIYLNGQLGAGKTTLVRGFLRGMAYQGIVKSPTYTLVETYDFISHHVHHFDFYRINAPEELEYIGIRDYFAQGICLLEWPEKAAGMLPQGDLNISIEIVNATRHVIIKPHTERGKNVLQTLLS